MMALRREEGQGVQHGWAEIKCERGETPIAHSGSPWNLSGPLKGYTLYSPQPCQTYCKTWYKVPLLCTTYVFIIELLSVCLVICVQLPIFKFHKETTTLNSSQQINAVGLTVVHSEQSVKKRNVFFCLFVFFNIFFEPDNTKENPIFSLYLGVTQSLCGDIFERKCCWTR